MPLLMHSRFLRTQPYALVFDAALLELLCVRIASTANTRQILGMVPVENIGLETPKPLRDFKVPFGK